MGEGIKLTRRDFLKLGGLVGLTYLASKVGDKQGKKDEFIDVSQEWMVEKISKPKLAAVSSGQDEKYLEFQGELAGLGAEDAKKDRSHIEQQGISPGVFVRWQSAGCVGTGEVVLGKPDPRAPAGGDHGRGVVSELKVVRNSRTEGEATIWAGVVFGGREEWVDGERKPVELVAWHLVRTLNRIEID